VIPVAAVPLPIASPALPLQSLPEDALATFSLFTLAPLSLNALSLPAGGSLEPISVVGIGVVASVSAIASEPILIPLGLASIFVLLACVGGSCTQNNRLPDSATDCGAHGCRTEASP
jgi:hypothetical protein